MCSADLFLNALILNFLQLPKAGFQVFFWSETIPFHFALLTFHLLENDCM